MSIEVSNEQLTLMTKVIVSGGKFEDTGLSDDYREEYAAVEKNINVIQSNDVIVAIESEWSEYSADFVDSLYPWPFQMPDGST